MNYRGRGVYYQPAGRTLKVNDPTRNLEPCKPSARCLPLDLHHLLQLGSVSRHRLANVRSRVGRAFPENRGPATKATPACSLPRHRLENVRSRVGRAYPENRGPTTGAAPADPKLHAMSA